MDKLKAMAVFVRIAEAGSLSAAAAATGASLPAVVRALAALEKSLGVRLFNRTTRRIALTDEGRRYLETCRRILTEVEAGEAALCVLAEKLAGHLAITAPVTFGQLHVAPAVLRFLQANPAIRCSLQLYDRVVDLIEEGIDVAIRIGALADSSLVAHPIGSLRRVTVASPAFLRRHGTPRHPRDLLDLNCVRFLSSTRTGWTFQERGKAVVLPITGNFDVNQAEPAVQACAAGLGVGNFLSYQPAREIAAKRLRIVLEDYEPPAIPIHAVYPHARLLPARARAFIDFVRQDLA